MLAITCVAAGFAAYAKVPVPPGPNEGWPFFVWTAVGTAAIVAAISLVLSERPAVHFGCAIATLLLTPMLAFFTLLLAFSWSMMQDNEPPRRPSVNSSSTNPLPNATVRNQVGNGP